MGVQEVILGRCIFRISTSHVGLGLSDLRIGDLVCVLYGCRICMVLHPDGANFNIVGPAYVDGAMGGEYIRAYEKGGSWGTRANEVIHQMNSKHML